MKKRVLNGFASIVLGVAILSSGVAFGQLRQVISGGGETACKGFTCPTAGGLDQTTYTDSDGNETCCSARGNGKKKL